MIRILSLVSVLAFGVAAAHPAWACGGFFCSVQNLQPVEQNAERILFVVNDDDTISAHVEISYSGRPEGFSWVVPVPDTPVLDVVPRRTLQLLDQGSMPQFILPLTSCGGFGGGGGGGCLGASTPLASSDSAGGFDGERNSSVIVEDLEQVGPYESVVVSSTDPQAINDWLNDNGYLVTVEMEPFIADYAAMGMKFLAMKLAPGTTASDIEPLKMTYPAQNPMIPLILTAVAAEPDMAVIIFIVGRDHYDSENWANIKIPTRDVQPRLVSVTGTNYRSLVSKRVDEAGGMAFVKEMADNASVAYNNAQGFVFSTDDNDALDYLATVLTSDKVLTRFYTRISGWEIADDPKFVPVPQDFATNIHDMSSRPRMDACAGSDPICGDRYCGQDAKCATTEFGEGCVCPEGGVLRRITNGFGVPLAICQESYFDMMASIEAMAAAQGIANPCDTYDCGTHGTCVVINGFPTCDCNDGFAGVATGVVGVTCARIEDTFSSSQVLAGFTAQVAFDDAGDGDNTGGGWCVASRDILTAPNVAMAGLVVVLWRRRRRAPA